MQSSLVLLSEHLDQLEYENASLQQLWKCAVAADDDLQ